MMLGVYQFTVLKVESPNWEMKEAYYEDITEAARTSENSTGPEISLVVASLRKSVFLIFLGLCTPLIVE